MLSVIQFRHLVIRPALEPLGLWSQIVENLLVGTALQESGLHWLKQVSGPACGIYQIEPQTYLWLRDKIKDHAAYRSILTSCNFAFLPSDLTVLIWHLRYATIVARFRYLVVPQPLPETNNVSHIAQYWKSFYNSELGKGTVDQFIQNYNRYNEQ